MVLFFIIFLIAGFLGAEIGHFAFRKKEFKKNSTNRMISSSMISLFLTLLYLFIVF